MGKKALTPWGESVIKGNVTVGRDQETTFRDQLSGIGDSENWNSYTALKDQLPGIKGTPDSWLLTPDLRELFPAKDVREPPVGIPRSLTKYGSA